MTRAKSDLPVTETSRRTIEALKTLPYKLYRMYQDVQEQQVDDHVQAITASRGPNVAKWFVEAERQFVDAGAQPSKEWFQVLTDAVMQEATLFRQGARMDAMFGLRLAGTLSSELHQAFFDIDAQRPSRNDFSMVRSWSLKVLREEHTARYPHWQAANPLPEGSFQGVLTDAKPVIRSGIGNRRYKPMLEKAQAFFAAADEIQRSQVRVLGYFSASAERNAELMGTDDASQLRFTALGEKHASQTSAAAAVEAVRALEQELAVAFLERFRNDGQPLPSSITPVDIQQLGEALHAEIMTPLDKPGVDNEAMASNVVRLAQSWNERLAIREFGGAPTLLGRTKPRPPQMPGMSFGGM